MSTTYSALAEDDEEPMGDYGDGMASLQAQNRALQGDLQDKNRYIATLEKRLLQARRTSSSRTSLGKGIMVGEDHSVSAALREKDVEIAELRARIEDKDRMLAALRSAARSRDVAEGIEHPKHETAAREARTSLLYEGAASPPPSDALPDPPVPAPSAQRKTRSVDEMSRILDEMIQDRVETGHLVRGSRGSVRVAADQRTSAVLKAANANPEASLESILAAGDEAARQLALEG